MKGYYKLPVTFYKLRFGDSVVNPVICYERDLRGVDEYFPFDATPLNDWPEPPPLFDPIGDIAEDYLGCDLNGWNIVSPAVQQCFDHLKVKGADFHPVNIGDASGKTYLDGYCVMHIWLVVSALDLQRSDWEAYPDNANKVMTIYREALNAQVLKDVDIFRLGEMDTLVFVSEKLVKAITSAKLTGFEFKPVQAH